MSAMDHSVNLSCAGGSFALWRVIGCDHPDYSCQTVLVPSEKDGLTVLFNPAPGLPEVGCDEIGLHIGS